MMIILMIILCLSNIAYGENIKLYQFESKIPDIVRAEHISSITISKEKYKDGESSLKWTFKGGEKLSLFGNIGYLPFKAGQKEKARSSYVMWIYNTSPIKGEMQIQFKEKGKLKSYFPLNMNFQGWRTMWVLYDRDMQGKPSLNMDEITFIAPKESGTVYIDHILPSVLIDPRHHARDEQLNFINLDADTSPNRHWMALYKNYQRIKADNSSIDLTDQDLNSISRIEKRFRERLLKKVKVDKNEVIKKEQLFHQYQKKSLEFKQKLVIYKEVKEEKKNLFKIVLTRDFGQYLRDIAYMYHSCEDKALKERLINLFNQSLDYMYEQGWTKGSAQGTVHHLGYQMREIYEAIFLMKAPLVASHKVNEAKEMLSWYSGLGMIYMPEEEFRVNIDVLNTMLPGMLSAILLNQDEKEKVKQLYLLQQYLNRSIQYSPGVLGGFKYDGTVFHHMQNYPAYAKGALEGLLPIIFYLHQTPFKISQENYQTLKNALLFTRLYANKIDILLSLSGRHPNDKFKINPELLAILALSDEKGVNKELAEAYLRLVPRGKYAKRFKSLGFQRENSPQGAWTANMGSLQLHRRQDWLVGMKGYSRYLVGNETYAHNNRYGRYMSYGAFQILQNSLKESGFIPEGWDWRHFPGTTAINVPFKKLQSRLSQVDTQSGVEEMLLSDETYSGGNNLNGHSMFAMKLHEHPKYNGSHRARKSVFVFDNRAILLGSGIENNDSHHETHTTLFQNSLKDKNKSFTQVGNLILDSQQNLYKIEAGNVILKKGLQQSFDQHNSRLTENPYELAYINHGKTPKGESYHFAVLIKGDKKAQQQFKLDSQYRLIHQDSHQHIVKDLLSNITAYALFEAGDLPQNDFILAIDTPALMMIQETNKDLWLSFVDPDLRLYEGRDPDLYKDGKMIERSIYSRPWIGNKGRSHTATVILKGKYHLEDNPLVKAEIVGENTQLKITSELAKVVKFKLKQE